MTESGVARNDLLRYTDYPDSVSGSDRVASTYNRLGQETTRTDQRGTVRTFEYDKLGRLTDDRVTTVGSDTDDTVLRISRTYEVRGMVETITSYDNATIGSGTALNQVKLVYNEFAQLDTESQEHGGTVSGSTPSVQYAYASGASSSNQIRPTSLTYPNSREIDFDYGSSGSLDDHLNRIAALKDGTTSLAAYTYLGAGTVIRIDYTEPEVMLDLWGGASGTFDGFDRFGRIVDQRWKYYGGTPADLDRYEYGYDRDSNRIWKQNTVGSSLDELYVYDALSRLVTMQRGTLNAAGTAIGGALVVGQLGRWVVSGNSGTHDVKLVDAATGTDLTGGLVTIDTDGATAGDYKYQALANPIALEASHSYYLMSQETNGGDQWYNYDTSLTATGDLTVNSADWYDTSYHVGTTGSYGYIPPNFTYGPDQPAITSQSLGTLRNNFTGWAGFKFTTTSGTPVREMNWALDPTGNWSSYLTKTNGTTDLDQTRTASKVNEITAIGGTPNWADPAYDDAGNTTTFPQADDPTSSFDALYDAWNRMVQVTDGEDTVATYAYDGRMRRTVQESYTTGSLSETRHFYFTNDWQDIEERLGTSPDTADPERQYVWGIRYIDELVCRDRDTDDDGTLDERLYALQDANFNVTGICDTAGTVVERFVFDPYGTRSIRNASWGILGSSAYEWIVAHQGLPYDETACIYYNRRRWLSSCLGGFLGRDPYSNLNGSSVYEYLRSDPIRSLDPAGLESEDFKITGITDVAHLNLFEIPDALWFLLQGAPSAAHQVLRPETRVKDVDLTGKFVWSCVDGKESASVVNAQLTGEHITRGHDLFIVNDRLVWSHAEDSSVSWDDCTRPDGTAGRQAKLYMVATLYWGKSTVQEIKADIGKVGGSSSSLHVYHAEEKKVTCPCRPCPSKDG